MRLKTGWFILCGMAAGIISISAVFCAQTAANIPDPVAKVNGQPVSRDLFWEQLLAYHGVYVLENLVGETILETEAKRRGVTVSETEIAQTIGERRKGMGILSDASFRSWLLQNEYTENRVRDEARLTVLLEKVFAQEANVTDAEVESYYDKNKASFTIPANVRLWRLSARTEEIAQKALQMLKGGKDFPAVAKELGPSLAQSAESAAAMPLAGLPSSMRVAIEKAPLGEPSGPIKVPQNLQDPNSPAVGYWVVKVEERLAERIRPFSEVREEIRRELFHERVFGPFGIGKRWLEQEREKANIERLLTFNGEPQPESRRTTPAP